jgi:spore germination protein
MNSSYILLYRRVKSSKWWNITIDGFDFTPVRNDVVMWSAIVSYIPGWPVFGIAAITLVIPIAVYFIYKAVYDFVEGRPRSSGPQLKDSEASLPETHPLSGVFNEDIEHLKTAIGMNSDVHIREFEMEGLQARAALIHVDGMQENKQVNLMLMKMLMTDVKLQTMDRTRTIIELERQLPLHPVREVTNRDDLIQSVLFGGMALLIEGFHGAIMVSMPDGPSRSIAEPVSESLLRGSRIGFTEVLGENTAMLRRQGLNEHLEMRGYQVGTRIKKDLVITYINDVVNPDLLQEVISRIERIDIDYVAESGYVEQLIEDNYLSPFQQTQNTERPDRVISSLLEGRIAILLDGTPFALIVPTTFSMLLQAPDDYYERWLPSSVLRMLRFLAAFISLLAPALYISFISFHPGLIPTELALTIIETRQGVPFPSLIEILILEVSIEILREAGIRLPKPIGPAMGIVGGLVIGEAAVQAGIVSPFLVIVVAITAISSFAIPVYSTGITLRLLRFVGMLFASVLGMYGTILFFLLVCSHLTKLKSFGTPYLIPFSPVGWSDWKDLFIRAPLSLMNRRPKMMKTKDEKRR